MAAPPDPADLPDDAPEAEQAEALFDRLLAGPLHLAGADGLEAPTHAGPWVLGARIGTGGLSTVYVAIRPTAAGPQRAAVKLAKRSGDETAALFAHEARLLQRLPTPAVAHLLDAGESADGRAYLALERIEGRSVSAVARDQTVWERLLLLWRVCRAVGARRAPRARAGAAAGGPRLAAARAAAHARRARRRRVARRV